MSLYSYMLTASTPAAHERGMIRPERDAARRPTQVGGACSGCSCRAETCSMPPNSSAIAHALSRPPWPTHSGKCWLDMSGAFMWAGELLADLRVPATAAADRLVRKEVGKPLAKVRRDGDLADLLRHSRGRRAEPGSASTLLHHLLECSPRPGCRGNNSVISCSLLSDRRRSSG